MVMKQWFSMNNHEVVYKLRDNDKIGTIKKATPATKKEEIDGERILPVNGQKKVSKFPKRIKSGSKGTMKLNTDYAKKDEPTSGEHPDPIKKGKPFSQQMRQHGKGRGKVVAKKPGIKEDTWNEFLQLPDEEKEMYLESAGVGHKPALDRVQAERTRRMYEDMNKSKKTKKK